MGKDCKEEGRGREGLKIDQMIVKEDRSEEERRGEGGEDGKIRRGRVYWGRNGRLGKERKRREGEYSIRYNSICIICIII